MKYFLQRDSRIYGPYSYDDLKRYQTENRIGPNDLIRQEDSLQWNPWQQVLNPAPVPAPIEIPPPPSQPPSFAAGGFTPPATPQAPTPGFGQETPSPFGQTPASFNPNPSGFGQNPSAPANNPQSFGGGFGQPPAGQGFGGFGQPQTPKPSDAPGAFGSFGAQTGFGGAQSFGQPAAQQPASYGAAAVGPMPPDMQWWLVLIISFFTCGIFLYFWMFKQSSFAKRIDPNCDARKFYTFAIILYVIGAVFAFFGGLLLAATGIDSFAIIPAFAQMVVLGGVVCIIIARFKMRTAVHNYYTTVEPMGINLMDTTGAVLTLFFCELFMQYHFANIAARKKALGHPSV